ncbi:hypothetical protein Q7C36_021600 [Tachysurus vachellii]|uniref:Uncharacterized protein n=1 Tax=Tachysurus vachellii TaxID=175792 RepID=A0AA88IT21_TACVA|nr:hypothetical protein Q7C36_021600 [Tachysurus vachellii]
MEIGQRPQSGFINQQDGKSKDLKVDDGIWELAEEIVEIRRNFRMQSDSTSVCYEQNAQEATCPNKSSTERAAGQLSAHLRGFQHEPVTSHSPAILSIWPFLHREPGTASFGCHRINLYHITFLSEAPGARLGQRPRANSDTETFNISFSIRSLLGFPFSPTCSLSRSY